jgi:hypothetical protein
VFLAIACSIKVEEKAGLFSSYLVQNHLICPDPCIASNVYILVFLIPTWFWRASLITKFVLRNYVEGLFGTSHLCESGLSRSQFSQDGDTLGNRFPPGIAGSSELVKDKGFT